MSDPRRVLRRWKATIAYLAAIGALELLLALAEHAGRLP
jgi:hypothetical protein